MPCIRKFGENFSLAIQCLAMGLQSICHRHEGIQNAFQMHSWMGPLHTSSKENLDEGTTSWSGNADSALFHYDSYKWSKPYINKLFFLHIMCWLLSALTIFLNSWLKSSMGVCQGKSWIKPVLLWHTSTSSKGQQYTAGVKMSLSLLWVLQCSVQLYCAHLERQLLFFAFSQHLLHFVYCQWALCAGNWCREEDVGGDCRSHVHKWTSALKEWHKWGSLAGKPKIKHELPVCLSITT